jgi:YHS domain-containing protein
VGTMCTGVEEFSWGIFLRRELRACKAQGIRYLAEAGTERFLLGRGVRQESWTGGIMTTDPVCGMKVDEKGSEFHTQFAGKKYFFCSDNCRKEFEADPDEFVETAAA